MTGLQIRQLVAWIIAVLTSLYMLPWAIAEQRDVQNKTSTGVLNFFLGWTVIGWIVTLFMACGQKQPQQATVVVHNTINN